MTKSIIQPERDCCYLCGKNGRAEYFGLDEHHVFSGISNRKLSEKYGLKVYLCHSSCHEHGKNSVHQNAEVGKMTKATAQRIAMEYYNWTIDDFRSIFGKSYL